MKIKWTPEQVTKLADFVRQDRIYRVELRGNKVVEVTPADIDQPWDCFRFAGSDTFHELNEYYPQDFQVFIKEPLKDWWEIRMNDENFYL
jgi:hypothetical protein